MRRAQRGYGDIGDADSEPTSSAERLLAWAAGLFLAFCVIMGLLS